MRLVLPNPFSDDLIHCSKNKIDKQFKVLHIRGGYKNSMTKKIVTRRHRLHKQKDRKNVLEFDSFKKLNSLTYMLGVP